MAESSATTGARVKIVRWPSERPLLALVWISNITIWILLAVTLFGIAYAVLIGLVFLLAHVAFIAHVRGNGVRLNPDQMPELYDRVVTLSRRVGLRDAPDAYVLQADGSLNALATRFLGSSFIVLYSDLLDACGDNTDARDFIIAHELGHLHAGHLRFRWFLVPALSIPFLGTAYSRACEYTCDRYGLETSEDKERALAGLCILAAGGAHGPNLNRRSLVAQRSDLNTITMKIGHWLSTHPPIAHRLAALQPSLGDGRLGGTAATVGALGVLLLAVALPIAATAGFAKQIWPRIQEAAQQQSQPAPTTVVPTTVGSTTVGSTTVRNQAEAGLLSLAEAAELHRANFRAPPEDVEQLYQQWSSMHPESAAPLDPYDGNRFGYEVEDGDYIIWSAGPDAEDDSDDLYYSSFPD